MENPLGPMGAIERGGGNSPVDKHFYYTLIVRCDGRLENVDTIVRTYNESYREIYGLSNMDLWSEIGPEETRTL